MFVKRLLAFVLFATLSFAQTPAKVETPTLTKTEQLALGAIQQQFNAIAEATKRAQADLAAFKEDFAKAHPGWGFYEDKGIVKELEKAK